MLLAASFWQLVGIVLAGLGAGLAVLVAQIGCFVALCRWADSHTNGLAYYGRPLAERRQFKRTLSRRARIISPLLWVLSHISKITFDRASFVYQSVAGPKDSCTVEDFRRAAQYVPTADDVFVVTVMKAGTTWMQHLVYQILTRGDGDLVESGRALYAISPWLESKKSVSMENAQFVGVQPRRIVKTHLPTTLCPYSAAARYIYVMRNPVSCFASTVDFIRTNLGPFDVSLDVVEEWFCSPLMWWGTWPEHVRRWWQWAEERPNVLCVRFEDMKRDLSGIAREVAAFLGVTDLSDEELEQIVRKCGFEYMQKNADAFEMSVPTVLQATPTLFVSGKIERSQGIPEATRQRLLKWCRDSVNGTDFPLAQLYPELSGAAGSHHDLEAAP